MENDILKSSYPNGNPKLECPIVDGKRNGLCILYYENGNICRKATFKDDLLDGVEETYHDNGMLRCKILFQQGRPVNGNVVVFDEKGKPALTEFWSNCRCKAFDSQDRLILEYGLFSTSYEGLYKRYFPNGNIKVSCEYSQGKIEGSYKSFYENGCVREEVFFRNGMRDGLEKRFYDTGDIMFETPYTNDKIEGIQKKYNRNGHLI